MAMDTNVTGVHIKRGNFDIETDPQREADVR